MNDEQNDKTFKVTGTQRERRNEKQKQIFLHKLFKGTPALIYFPLLLQIAFFSTAFIPTLAKIVEDYLSVTVVYTDHKDGKLINFSTYNR